MIVLLGRPLQAVTWWCHEPHLELRARVSQGHEGESWPSIRAELFIWLSSPTVTWPFINNSFFFKSLLSLLRLHCLLWAWSVLTKQKVITLITPPFLRLRLKFRCELFFLQHQKKLVLSVAAMLDHVHAGKNIEFCHFVLICFISFHE